MLRAMALSALLYTGLCSPEVHAQSAEPRFDVTSVKLNTLPPQQRIPEFGCQGGRFVGRAQWVERVIRYAYDIEFFQLGGLPKWADDEMYDIEARANPATTESQCRAMVRGLLADRFKLVIRREAKEVPVLALVVDKNGPKMRKATADDEPNGPEFVVNGKPMQMFSRELAGMTMAQLVQALGIAQLGMPILDKTGLEGMYRISLRFSPRGTEGKDPEVTTALREQLGLRLESQRGKIEFLTVTRLERPDAN
jgi:uncharacterized protein (TIGR03435 family)